MALRYVILRHEQIDEPHFDLMFETAAGSALATWRSEFWPISHATTLVRLDDHRPHYLTYEGPVSGNRGAVHRIESGTIVYRSPAPDSIEVILQSDSRTIGLKLARVEAGDTHWLASPFAGA
jgi:hypothetical protein